MIRRHSSSKSRSTHPPAGWVEWLDSREILGLFPLVSDVQIEDSDLLESQLKLGSLFGIRIGVHYSWLLVASLIVFSFTRRFHEMYPNLSASQVLLLAVSTAVLFFVCLLLHELSHSLIARSRGIAVREITLFALGGVSQLEGEAVSARAEFAIAIVGPAASVALGLGFLGISHLLAALLAAPLVQTLSLLGYINLGLAAFNMIPGYPLDGGRVLRAAIWWKTGNLEQATRMAAKAGQAVGLGFILVGIGGFFSGSGFSGLWIAFIGWFLLQAAGASYLEAGVKKALSGVHASDVMTHECPTVNSSLSLQDLVDQELLRTGRRCFMVVDNGRVAGLVTPGEITQVDRTQWPVTAVSGVMKPLSGLRTIAPSASLASALEIMGREDINQLPVIDNGHLEGLLSRADVLNYLQTRLEFQASEVAS